MVQKPACLKRSLRPPFSRWVLPIADICNPFGVLKIGFYLTFLSLKGIHTSAQGTALRHQDKFRTSTVLNEKSRQKSLKVISLNKLPAAQIIELKNPPKTKQRKPMACAV